MNNYNETTTGEHSQISELVDGRLSGIDFSQTVDFISQDESYLEVWHRYHLIGDLMRGQSSAADGFNGHFLAGIRTRLANDPPIPSTLLQVSGDGVVSKPLAKKASNDTTYRWRMLAGVASLAAIVSIGWNLVVGAGVADAARLAESASANSVQAVVSKPNDAANAANAAAPAPVMLRDPNLDALLAAHKQFGGTSALQMPTGFIRNATFESDSK